MDGSRIPYALLILCWIHVAGASVPPPTNVTLSLCRNMHNTLQWSYPELSPGLRFRIEVGATYSELVTLWVDSPALSVDLSSFSNPGDDYVAFVTAVNGTEESEPEPEDGVTFSYYKDSIAANKCRLDLPEVNVTALEEKLLRFSFTHPGLLYSSSSRIRRKKNHDSQRNLPGFHFHIEVVNQNESRKFECMESVCQDELTVHGHLQSYCLNISGEMTGMSVQATQAYCSQPYRPQTNLLPIVLPLVLALVSVGVIVAMIYIKQTRPNTKTLKSLTFLTKGREQGAGLAPGEYTSVDVVPASPRPLLTPDEERTPTSGDPFRDELRRPLGLAPTNPDPDPEPESGPGGEGTGYTEGRCLDDDEEEEQEEGPTPYEKRVVIDNVT